MGWKSKLCKCCEYLELHGNSDPEFFDYDDDHKEMIRLEVEMEAISAAIENSWWREEVYRLQTILGLKMKEYKHKFL